MNKKQYFYSNLFAWGLVLLLIGNHVFGWTTPSQDPPGGNVILETGAAPVGSTGYIQFNDAGNLGADSNLFWDNTNKCLGIGTTAPKNKLDVEGGGVIGATYSGINTAPSNGLLVQGNVGIGTTSPGTKLEVAGAIKVGTQETCDGNAVGAIRYVSTQYEERFEGCNGESWKLIALISTESLCDNEITFTYKDSEVTYGIVESDGKCWMDRNLGASQVATAVNDSLAYGDLFQWGRLDDGHQNRTSGITSTLSSTDNPGHSNFIKSYSSAFYDWRSPQNHDLWDGVDGINNPCPPGWRPPTANEWQNQMNTWEPSNNQGAFASTLKLPAGGSRNCGTAGISNAGSFGAYWSHESVGEKARRVSFSASSAYMYDEWRGSGHSVRCIKD